MFHITIRPSRSRTRTWARSSRCSCSRSVRSAHPLLRHVAEDGHRAEHQSGRIADGRRRDVGDAFGAVPGNQDGRTRQSEAAPLAECPVDGALDLKAAVLLEHPERRTDGATRGLIRAPPAESLGERIQEIDPPLRVGGDHRVAHAGQRDAVPFLGLAELSLGLSALADLLLQPMLDSSMDLADRDGHQADQPVCAQANQTVQARPPCPEAPGYEEEDGRKRAEDQRQEPGPQPQKQAVIRIADEVGGERRSASPGPG